MWQSGAGKGPSDYVDEASSRLDRKTFDRELREFVGQSVKLRKTDVRVLFDISEENCRTLTAIYSMKKDKLIQDWSRRRALITKTAKHLNELQENLKKVSADARWPATALVATFALAKLTTVQDDLHCEFENVRQHQRISESMLQALSLKAWRSLYLAELDNYILTAFPGLQKRQTDTLIAGLMTAAHLFTKRERANDPTVRVAMARLRANNLIKKLRDDVDDAPVFRTTPRKRTSL